MTSTTATSVTVPLAYADPASPPGLFYALQHADSTCRFRPVDTVIRNARTVDEEFSLATTGFQLVDFPTRVQDFTDEAELDRVYDAELQELVRSLTGAEKVIVFHRITRQEGGESLGGRQPARNPHVDYDGAGFEEWVRQTLGDEADRWLAGRWTAVNVWRGIRPVERTPLAVTDARSIRRDEDFVPVPIHERPGAPTPFTGLNLKHDERQRWYYFPDMQPDEALCFRLYDSDPSAVFPVAHSAIDDPTSRPDAAPRYSIEARTVAFYG